MPTTKETEQTSYYGPYKIGGEWASLWNKLRAANDGKTTFALTPLDLGVLVTEVAEMFRKTGVAWDTLMMRLHRPCDGCFKFNGEVNPDCPVCKGAGYLPVQIPVSKFVDFIAGRTLELFSKEIKRLNEAQNDGK